MTARIEGTRSLLPFHSFNHSHGNRGVGKSPTGSQGSSHKNGFGDLLIGGPFLFRCLDMTLDTVGALSRMSHGEGDEFLYLPWKGAFLFEDLVVEVDEGLEHILLSFHKILVVLAGVEGIKIFIHGILLSSFLKF